MSDKENARTQVAALVARFAGLSEQEKRAFSEEDVKQGFLLPLFRSLCWDVENRNHVRAEVRTGRGIADYLFLIDGVTVFPLEAKRISSNLNDSSFMKQAISYAWNKNLPWAVLSNFDTLIIFIADPTISPVYQSRFRLLKSEDFSAAGFEDLWLLSRPAMAQRQIERVAEREGRLPPREGVNRVLFADLTRWRRKLFSEITEMQSTPWSQEHGKVDEAIQRFFDRLIFIRTLEDRKIEDDLLLTRLREHQQTRDSHGRLLFEELQLLFREMDHHYNARLFALHALDTEFQVHDVNLLQEIIQGLHDVRGHHARYEFATISADVLGAVYEQYLAFRAKDPLGEQEIDLSKKRRRKALGIYYTPAYVVRYIVQQTLGKLLSEPNLTPNQVHDLKTLDPACGSGSFLIEAFRLLDSWLAEHGDAEDRSYPHIRRLRILQRNLFGVDLDPQAVEVARLNLLLRAAWQRGQLPMLHNIRHGNSLIDNPDIAGEAAFNWHEHFPSIVDRGGFDVIVGNPPYGALLDIDSQGFLADRFTTFGRLKDVYTCFIELSIELLRENGFHSFIVPAAWLGGPAYQGLRSLLLNHQVLEVLALPFDVFDAYIDTSIFVLAKSVPPPCHSARTFRYPSKVNLLDINIRDAEYHHVAQSAWAASPDQKFVLDGDALAILLRLSNATEATLGDFILIRRGVLFDNSILTAQKVNERQHLYFEGDVYRYNVNSKLDNWVEFGSPMKEYPRDFLWFEGERLLLRRLVNRRHRLMSSLVNATFITNKNLYSIKAKHGTTSIRFLLALLNSKLFSFLYLSQVSQATKDDFPQVTIQDLKSLPYPSIHVDTFHALDSLVDRMLKLHASHSVNEDLFDDRRHEIQHQIDHLDSQIDAQIYKLYDLHDDEIAIIEDRIPLS